MYSYRVYKCKPRKIVGTVIPVDFRTRAIPCNVNTRELVSEGWENAEYAKKWADANIFPPFTYEIRRHIEAESRFTKEMAKIHPMFVAAAARMYVPLISGITDSGIPGVEDIKKDKSRADVLDVIWKHGRKAFGGTRAKGKRYIFVAGLGHRQLDNLTDDQINHYLEVMFTGHS